MSLRFFFLFLVCTITDKLSTLFCFVSSKRYVPPLHCPILGFSCNSIAQAGDIVLQLRRQFRLLSVHKYHDEALLSSE